MRYDCVTFYRYLETIRVRDVGQHSLWLFLDVADELFRLAKGRVYSSKRKKDAPTSQTPKKKKKLNTEESDEEEEEKKEESGSQSLERDFTLVLEENPKWKLLSEVLDEIENEINKSASNPEFVVSWKLNRFERWPW